MKGQGTEKNTSDQRIASKATDLELAAAAVHGKSPVAAESGGVQCSTVGQCQLVP